MPLAQVLSVMAKPPGSAPPFVPWKPVPRLVPLPGSHTLAVARPELRDAASYGNLRADNLQLSITAQVRYSSLTRQHAFRLLQHILNAVQVQLFNGWQVIPLLMGRCHHLIDTW
jgi:hypothetical protein